MRSPTRWITAANGVLGLWLIAAPFVLTAPRINRWNDIVSGTIIVSLAGYNLHRERGQKSVDHRAAVINGILGGWLVVAPFVYGTSGMPLWNDVSIGVLVTSFAGYNAYAAAHLRETTTYSRHEDV